MTLPDGWRRVQIGEVAETALGKMLDKGRSKGFPLVRYLRNVNVQWGRIDTHDLYEMELADADRDRFGVEPGDLLVCEGGEIGRSAIWRGDGEYIAFQKALHRIRPSGALDTVYLRYALELAAEDGTLERHSTGSTIAHLPQQQLRQVSIALPPLDEQRRIVEILEENLSNLDVASDALRLATARVSVLRRSSLERAWTAGIGFGADQLGNVASTALGKMLDAKKAQGTATPYLRNINVRWGRIDLDDLRTVPLRAEERADFSLHEGDLLVCEGGEPGRCAVWKERRRDVAYQKALHRVRVHDRSRLEPEYVAAMVEYVITSGRAASLFTGTTIKHLPQTALRSMQIPLPPLANQIASLVDIARIEAAGAETRQQLESANSRAVALRRALLQAAFSGQLTGRPSDLDRAEELVS